jgi:hypothetical protein
MERDELEFGSAEGGLMAGDAAQDQYQGLLCVEAVADETANSKDE